MIGARRTAARTRRRLVWASALALVVIAAVGVMVTRASTVHTYGARVMHLTIDSRFVHGRMHMTVVLPAAARRHAALLIFLHGRGGDENSELSTPLFAALRSLGRNAPDIAFPDGGDHSYWHNRHDGAWSSYVLREVLPKAISATHADPRRIAIGGISMGGFGAYNIARLAPNRFCAVGGHSAALWTSAGDTAPGAFDDAADFAANDIIALARAHPDLYGHARLWLDGGNQDPFHTADEALASALHIPMHVWPGAHDPSYWSAHYSNYLHFYATALAKCR